jgi:hypothetical protein
MCSATGSFHLVFWVAPKRQVIRVIKTHAVFRSHFRGGTRMLSAIVLRFHPKYPHPECGPWDHYDGAGFGDPRSESGGKIKRK